MVCQNTCTIPRSIRISKMWFELLRINAGNLTWGFWDIGQNDMTALGQSYNIEELLNWQEPYVKSLEKMKVFLKCVVSYLSRGNFEGELDRWLNLAQPAEGEPPGGNMGAERTALIDQTPESEGSIVSTMTRKSREMLQTIDYSELKLSLSENLATTFNTYQGKLQEVQGIKNKVIRQESTKEHALAEIETVLVSL